MKNISNKTFSLGDIVVETLSDEEVDRMLQKEEDETETEDATTKEDVVEEVTLPQVDEEADEFLQLSRIDRILELFDAGNERVNEDLGAKAESEEAAGRFLEVDNAVLSKLYLQSLWEDPEADYEGALHTVLSVVAGFGRDGASEQVDQDMSRYVDKAVLATGPEDAPLKKAVSLAYASLEGAVGHKTRLSAILEAALPAPRGQQTPSEAASLLAARKYLAINPVIMELFARLKLRVIQHKRKGEL